jgi:uncharacterized protein YoxC
MTITLGVSEIAILIVALAFLALVIALIPTLLQLKRTIKAVEELAGESKTAVASVNHIIVKTGEQIEDVEELTRRVKEVGTKVVDLLEMIVDTVKNPLITLLGLIIGFEFGFRKLFKREEKKD